MARISMRRKNKEYNNNVSSEEVKEEANLAIFSLTIFIIINIMIIIESIISY